MNVERLSIEAIQIPERLRAFDPSRVAQIAASIEAIGLQTPLSVRVVPEMEIEGLPWFDVPVLVTGRHRLEVVKSLGHTDVDCLILEGDEIECRLWEIAENLHRIELSVQERADHIAEWVRLTEERNKSALCADIPRGRGQPQGGLNAAVRELGIDRTEAQRAVKMASISPEARAAADEAGLTTQKARLEIAAAETAEEQVAKVTEITRRIEDHKRFQKSGDDLVVRDAADDAAQIILNFVPQPRMEAMLGYLDAAGAARIAKAIRRAIKLGERAGDDQPVFDGTPTSRGLSEPATPDENEPARRSRLRREWLGLDENGHTIADAEAGP